MTVRSGFVASQVRMIRGKVRVRMFQVFEFFCWPKEQGGKDAQSGQTCHDKEGGGQAKGRPQPPGQRISKQPASVAQRELRGKDRGAVLGLGRAAE